MIRDKQQQTKKQQDSQFEKASIAPIACCMKMKGFPKDRDHDLEFWSRVSCEDKFKAAWDLVLTHWIIKGNNPDDLRLRRTVVLFKPGKKKASALKKKQHGHK